jgi:hypothetical protein
MVLLLGGFVATVGSVVALKFLPAPFVWVALLYGVTLGGSAVVTRARTPKRILLSAATIVVGLGAVEATLLVWGAPPPPQVRVEVSPPFDMPDSILGWRLRPSQVSHAVEQVRDSVIYDVRYTVDSAGRRIAPPSGSAPTQDCVLFFGDSFTFGKGVSDDATLPYRVGVRSKGRIQVVNFSAPVYGPHQLLAGLERGGRDAEVTCHPSRIVYQTLAHDVLRVAGLDDVARFTPRYAIGLDGSPRYVGTPQRGAREPGYEQLWQRAAEQLRKSRVFQWVTDREPEPSAADLKLYLAVVRRFRDLLQVKYPDAEFHVLLWVHHGYSSAVATLKTDLESITPHVHVVDDILPEYATHPERYELHPLDELPNALAYDLLAGFVADSVMGSPH